ncbi:MAG TPA: sigma-70 family RNA polymerase sigma factor [Candidatus Sulfotelmatobacter sp.]|nr:sigma-70 family RNA polymerase sigma factor [Candidatus Sulfotelmatobacter sp.]
MMETDFLAQNFEQNRGHLRAVAYRMLGSVTEADDAIQEAWLRLSRSDATQIENLGGWLTTVVARVCLDMLRSRSSRKEEPLDVNVPEPVAKSSPGSDPEQETLLADSVGLAVMVVLDRLNPSERLAFVLHDMFGMSFEEIASIVGKSPAAARQLASRARRRVQGGPIPSDISVEQQRPVVERFLSALRSGDFEALVAVLDPEVEVHIDEAAARPGAPRELHGAQTFARGAITFARMATSTEPMLLDGSVGLVWAPQGHLQRALQFTFKEGRIATVDIIAEAAHLRKLQLAVLR